MSKLLWRGLMVGVALLAAMPSIAQRFPDKPFRIVVPFPPGGFNDTLGRIVAQKLTEAWGQPAVVDNRAGGGSTIGTDIVAKAVPDGQTLLVVAFPFAVNASLYPKLPYDTLRDFAPIMMAGETPNLLVVNASSPVKSVAELLATARAQPGKLSYGSAGSGSSNHLSMELFKMMAAVNLVHIPYKGSAPMLTDLLGGQLDALFDNTPNALPHVKAGKLRALATTSAKRSSQTPDVPTVAEAGLPGYEVGVWFGLVAPSATPPEVIAKLNAELNRMLTMPDVRQRFSAAGVEPAGGTAQQFGEHIRSEMAKWAKVVKESGAKAD
jgi:tripartite-type tricarboxylate transporter receptor subunit TctC